MRFAGRGDASHLASVSYRLGEGPRPAICPSCGARARVFVGRRRLVCRPCFRGDSGSVRQQGKAEAGSDVPPEVLL